jgi:hypothetical protein
MEPVLLPLEDRRLLSTFQVTSAADSDPAIAPAPHTLRWVVKQANAATSARSIEIELGSSPATIALAQSDPRHPLSRRFLHVPISEAES